MSNHPVLKVTGISHTYGTGARLHGIGFEVDSGEVLGLLGRNGAGKSTTLKIIAGLLAPHSGSVELLGSPFDSDAVAMRRHIGYVPEHPALYTAARVDEYLAYRAALYGISGAQVMERLQHIKQRCGLSKVGSRLIGTLSKGYRQRVSIAQALIHKPALLLLDEPTDGLDPIQIIEIRRLIQELGREHAVIFSTHRLAEVETCCTRAVIMDQGTIAYSGTLTALRTAAEVSQLVVGFSTNVPAERLRSIGGVEQVEELDTHRFVVSCRDRNFVTHQIIETAMRESWGLLEIQQREIPLEQLFTRLVEKKCA